MRGFVDAGAASDHLIKQNTGFQITEKYHGIEPFYIDAGGQQVHGAGNKSAFAGAAHRFDQFAPAVGGAFEGVQVFGCSALLFAPCAVQVVHLHDHAIGVDVAGTENNHFLFGATVLAKLLEQIFAHGGNTFRHQQLAVKMSGRCIGL